MSNYETLEIEVIAFSSTDIIVTSKPDGEGDEY